MDMGGGGEGGRGGGRRKGGRSMRERKERACSATFGCLRPGLRGSGDRGKD